MLVQNLLPFQFTKDKSGGAITAFVLINKETGVEYDILSDIRSKGMTMYREADHDNVYFPGYFPLTTSIPEGTYYAKMTDAGGPWYSEDITFTSSVSNYIKITYYHKRNFYLRAKTGEFLKYDGTFRHYVYLPGVIKNPSYQKEARATRRLGLNFYNQQISYKMYNFGTSMAEFHHDHLRHVELHDVVEIDYLGEHFEVDDIIIQENWDDYGDVSDATVEFQTDTVAITNGEAIEGNGGTTGSQACLPYQYFALGEISKFSSDFTSGTYDNGNGTPDQNDYIIVAENALIKRLYKFAIGQGWQLVTTLSEGDTIYDINGIYYFYSGLTLKTSIITSIVNTSGDTYTVKGYSFASANLLIKGRLVDGTLVDLNLFTNDATPYFEVSVTQQYLASVRVEPQSGACTNFADSPWKDFKMTGLNYMALGVDFIVSEPVDIG